MGETVELPCVYNRADTALTTSRSCVSLNTTHPTWTKPHLTKCLTRQDLEILHVREVTVTPENAAEVTQQLREVVRSVEEVSSAGIQATVSILSELECSTAPDDTQDILEIGSSLLDASTECLGASKEG